MQHILQTQCVPTPTQPCNGQQNASLRAFHDRFVEEISAVTSNKVHWCAVWCVCVFVYVVCVFVFVYVLCVCVCLCMFCVFVYVVHQHHHLHLFSLIL